MGGVAGPNLVDVVLVVAVKERGVEDDAVVGAQSAQIAAGGLWDDEGGPACAVGGGLGPQALADGVESVGCHARDMLRCVGGVGQSEGYREADKVDVGDVNEKLGGIEGKFAEVPRQIYIWV